MVNPSQQSTMVFVTLTTVELSHSLLQAHVRLCVCVCVCACIYVMIIYSLIVANRSINYVRCKYVHVLYYYVVCMKKPIA